MKTYHFRKTIDLEILAKNKRVLKKIMEIINKNIPNLDYLIDELNINEGFYCAEFDDDLDFDGWNVQETDWTEVD